MLHKREYLIMENQCMLAVGKHAKLPELPLNCPFPDTGRSDSGTRGKVPRPSGFGPGSERSRLRGSCQEPVGRVVLRVGAG